MLLIYQDQHANVPSLTTKTPRNKHTNTTEAEQCTRVTDIRLAFAKPKPVHSNERECRIIRRSIKLSCNISFLVVHISLATLQTASESAGFVRRADVWLVCGSTFINTEGMQIFWKGISVRWNPCFLLKRTVDYLKCIFVVFMHLNFQDMPIPLGQFIGMTNGCIRVPNVVVFQFNMELPTLDRDW